MPQQKVWIVHFGGWRYIVQETTAAALQQSLFGQGPIAYTDMDSAIAACQQKNQDFEQRKQRQMEAA